MTAYPPRGTVLAATGAMVIASAFVAAATLSAKALGQGVGGVEMHPLQVSAGRFLFAFIAVATAAMVLRPSFKGTPIRLHAARTCFGWSGVSCMFAASAVMPLSDATAISFLNPIFTMLLAGFMLGERVRALQWLGVAIALSGAMVLIQPGGDAFQPMGLVALIAAVLLGLEVVLIKRLSNNNEPAIRILLINNGIGTVLACAAAIPVWQTPPLAQLWIWAAVGLTMVSGQVIFIWVMKRAPASLMTPVFYSTLVFAALYDWLLFAVVPGLLAIGGASLIVAGLLLPTLWTKADPVPSDANDRSADGGGRQ